jgi:hypothetical protein
MVARSGWVRSEVALVPDQATVQQLAPAGLYPALHHGIHPWYPDAALDDLQPGIGQHRVEGCREHGIPVAYQEPGRAARIL